MCCVRAFVVRVRVTLCVRVCQRACVCFVCASVRVCVLRVPACCVCVVCAYVRMRVVLCMCACML